MFSSTSRTETQTIQPPPPPESGSPTTSRSGRSVKIRTSETDEDEALLPLLPRKHSYPKEKKVPKILDHYQIFSYVIYSFCIIIFLAYLIYVAILLCTPVFYIQYEPVVKLYEYNSYNLICPFLGVIFCIKFMYHVKTRVKLEEGDFFGLIGIIIFFCMIMCYDGTGIINLYQDRLHYLSHSSRYNETYNDAEANSLAWQYAWSNIPTCARIHAKKNHEIQEEKEEHDQDDTHGPDDVKSDENVLQSPWMLEGLKGRGSEEEVSGSDVNDCPNKKDEKEQTANDITHLKVCNCQSYAADKPSRKWMVRMQKTYKCCGPRGYDDWTKRVSDAETTCRASKSGPRFEKGCAVPFNTFLAGRLFTTIWFMFTLVVIFIVIMITSCCHFAAMKYEDTGVIHEYSLLDLTEPDDRPVVEIKRQKTVSKLIYSDAVRGILQSSNLRAQKRKSPVSGSVSFGGPNARINPAHFKNISHTVMSTFGRKFGAPKKDNTTPTPGTGKQA